jgi:hypothetical protein
MKLIREDQVMDTNYAYFIAKDKQGQWGPEKVLDLETKARYRKCFQHR